MIFGPGNWENREEKRKKEKNKGFSQKKDIKVFFWKGKIFDQQKGMRA